MPLPEMRLNNASYVKVEPPTSNNHYRGIITSLSHTLKHSHTHTQCIFIFFSLPSSHLSHAHIVLNCLRLSCCGYNRGSEKKNMIELSGAQREPLGPLGILAGPSASLPRGLRSVWTPKRETTWLFFFSRAQFDRVVLRNAGLLSRLTLSVVLRATTNGQLSL